MLDALESGDKFLDIFTRRRPNSPRPITSQHHHPGTADPEGPLLLMKDGLMF